MEAHISDHQSQALDVLFIRESPITIYRAHVNHSAWRLYRPTVESDSVRFQSPVYVNHNPLSTSPHRQGRCNQPDLMAIRSGRPTPRSWSSQSRCRPYHCSRLMEHRQKLPYQQSTTRFKTSNETTAKPLASSWPETSIAATQHGESHHNQPRFIEDARELISCFHEHCLQGCLPRRTLTLWSLRQTEINPTIHQTVTNRPDLLLKPTSTTHDKYGSDH
jgi:hypothetical protein